MRITDQMLGVDWSLFQTLKLKLIMTDTIALEEQFKRIDARSLKLIEEFEEHWEVVNKHTSNNFTREKCFEAWIFQKLAGIQIVLEALKI